MTTKQHTTLQACLTCVALVLAWFSWPTFGAVPLLFAAGITSGLGTAAFLLSRRG